MNTQIYSIVSHVWQTCSFWSIYWFIANLIKNYKKFYFKWRYLKDNSREVILIMILIEHLFVHLDTNLFIKSDVQYSLFLSNLLVFSYRRRKVGSYKIKDQIWDIILCKVSDFYSQYVNRTSVYLSVCLFQYLFPNSSDVVQTQLRKNCEGRFYFVQALG